MAIVRNVSVPSFYVRPVLNAVAVKPIINTYAPRQKKLQRQHVKDLGDLLLGTPLTGTLQLRHTLQDNDLRDLVYVPVLNRLAGAALLVKERTLKPILEGKPNVAAVNALETLGSTSDTLANIVKSLVPGAGGGKAGDFARSLGLKQNEYRKYFQYDSGSWLTNLLCELLSDPTFVIGFTSNLAMYGMQPAVDALTLDTIKAYAKEAGGEAIEHVISDDLLMYFAKELGDSVIDDPAKIINKLDDFLKTEAKNYIKEVSKLNSTNTLFSHAFAEEKINKLREINQIRKRFKNYTPSEVIGVVRNDKLMNTYRSIRKINETADAIDNALMSAGLALPSAGVANLTWAGAKYTFKATANYIRTHLKEIDLKQVMNNTEGVIRKVENLHKTSMKTRHAQVFQTGEEFFKRYNLDYDKLGALYQKVYQSIPKNRRAIAGYVDNKFFDSIISVIHSVKGTLDSTVSDTSIRDEILNNRTIKNYIAGIMLAGEEANKVIDLAETAKTMAQKEKGKLITANADEAIKVIDDLNTSLTDVVKSNLDVELTKHQSSIELAKVRAEFYNSYIALAEATSLTGDQIATFLSKLLELNNHLKTLELDPKFNNLNALYSFKNSTAKLYNLLTNAPDDAAFSSILKNNLESVKNKLATTLDRISKSTTHLETINKRITNPIYSLRSYLNALSTIDETAAIKIADTLEQLGININPDSGNLQQVLKYWSAAKAGDDKAKQQLVNILAKGRNQTSMSVFDHNSAVKATRLKSKTLTYGDEPRRKVSEAFLKDSSLKSDPNSYTDYFKTLNDVMSQSDKAVANAKTLQLDLSNLIEDIDAFRTLELELLNTTAVEDLIVTPVLDRFLKLNLVNTEESVKLFKTTFDELTDAIKQLDSIVNNLNKRSITLDVVRAKTKEDIIAELKIQASRLADTYKARGVTEESALSALIHAQETKGWPSVGTPTTVNKSLKNISRYIKDIKTLLQNKSTVTTYTLYSKILDLNSRVYSLKTNAIHNFIYTYNMVDSLQTATDSKFWLELLDNTSDTRREYGKVIKKLYAQNEPMLTQVANNMQQMLAIIDASNLLARTYAEAQNIWYNIELPEPMIKTLYNSLLDEIYNSRYIRVSSLTSKQAKEMATKIYNRVYSLHKHDLLELLYKQGLNIYDVEDGLIDDILACINRYVTGLQEVSDMYDLDLYMFSNYTYFGDSINGVRYDNNGVISLADSLGSYAGDVQEAFNKGTLDANVTVQVENFIEHITGALERPDIDSFNAKVVSELQHKIGETPTLPRSKKELAAQKYSEKVLKVERSLARTITDAFRDLRILSEDLQKEFGLIVQRDLQQNITKTLGTANVADFLVWDNYHGLKTALDPWFVKEHNLRPIYDLIQLGSENIKYTDTIHWSQEFFQLYDMFHTAYTQLERVGVIDQEYVQSVRATLKKYQQNKLLAWTPHAVDYFDNCTDLEILTWGRVYARANTNFVPEFARKELRSLQTRLDYYSDPISLYYSLDSITDEFMSVENIFDESIYNYTIKDHLQTVGDYAMEDLVKPLKDPASWGKAAKLHNNWINQDVEYLQNVLDLSVLENNTATVGTYIKNPKDLKELAKYGIMPHTKMNSNNVLNYLKQERNQWLLASFKSWNASQFRSWLDHNTDGCMILVTHDNSVLTNILKQQNEAGLQIKLIDKGRGIYFIRRTDTKITNVAYEYIVNRSIFQKQQDIVTKVFEKNRNYFYWDGMDIPNAIFTGDMLDKEIYETILRSKHFSNYVGSIEEQKLYRKLDKNGNNSFFTRKISRPNMVVVGDSGAFNEILDYTQDAFNSLNVKSTPISNNLVKSAAAGSISAVKRVNSEHKYLQLMFNEDYFIGNNLFWPRLTALSDADLKEIFTKQGWVAAIVRENSSGHPTVYRIYVENQKQLLAAREAGASILTREMYRNAVLSINQHKLENKILKMYQRTIAGTFKTIYLHSLGYLLRNGLDSAIFKNANTTDGLVGVIDNFKYEIRAAKLLDQHNKLQMRMLELARLDGYETLNRRYIQKVLQEVNATTRTEYILTDLFIKSGASSGLAKAMQDTLLEFNKNNSVFDGFAWEQAWNDILNKVPTVQWINQANDTIEQASRFGLFLKLVDDGGDITSSLRKVIDTHFDYKLKEGGLEWIDDIFWFSTFPINNFFYFINGGLTRNPELLKLQLEMMEQSWNSNGITFDDVRKSNYLTYNMLAGNIRFSIKDKNYVLKIGSSLFDFFNIIFNTLDTTTDRLNPFLSVLFGVDKINQLNPFNSFGSKAKQIITGKSYLPSVYSQLYTNKYKRRPYFKNSSNYGGTWRRYPRRLKRYKAYAITHYPYNSKYHYYKFQSRFRPFGFPEHIIRKDDTGSYLYYFKKNPKYLKAIRTIKKRY